MVRARIRGIFSTALTRLLLDHGFEMVQPSSVIRERFKLENYQTRSPPDIDIYDRIDRQGIIAFGLEGAVENLASIFQSTFDDVILRRRFPTYSRRDRFLTYHNIRIKESYQKIVMRSDSKRCQISAEFPALSKKKLDDLRSSVTPTLEGHHYYKTCGRRIASFLEMAERMLEKGCPRGEVERLFKETIRREYPHVNSKVDIEHVKIDGRIFNLDNAKILEFDEDRGMITLRRVFIKKGVYNGLKITKDPGDYALTKLRIGGWSLQTRYFTSDGRYKGTYINLNTPIELYPDRIRYVDLEVDICVWPNGRVEKIDEGKLDERIAQGYLSKRLGEIVKEKIEEIMRSVGIF